MYKYISTDNRYYGKSVYVVMKWTFDHVGILYFTFYSKQTFFLNTWFNIVLFINSALYSFEARYV